MAGGRPVWRLERKSGARPATAADETVERLRIRLHVGAEETRDPCAAGPRLAFGVPGGGWKRLEGPGQDGVPSWTRTVVTGSRARSATAARTCPDRATDYAYATPSLAGAVSRLSQSM